MAIACGDSTLASELTAGLVGNCTSVALSIVFSSKIVAWDWLCPNGFFPTHSKRIDKKDRMRDKKKNEIINKRRLP